MSEKFYIIEAKHFPKVVIRFTTAPITDAHVQSFVSEMNALYDYRTPFAILFDTRNLSLGRKELGFARVISGWIETNRVLAEKYMQRTAVYIVNPFVRTFVNLVLTFSKTVAPCSVSGELQHCYAFLGWI